MKKQNHTVRLLAPAKINLGLWVVGKLPDGYHEIRTIFYKLSQGDIVKVSLSDKPQVISSSGPQGEDNIAYKAIKLLSEYTGQPLNLRIEIEKKIPIGAGLGGGSSDAASAIKAAIKLFDIQIGKEELLELGMKIGADVPFFLMNSRAAIGRGKGELLEPIDLNLNANVSLECPKVSVSTAWAYNQLSARKLYASVDDAETAIEKIIEAIKRSDLSELGKWLFNSFEEVVFDEYPSVRRIKEALVRRGAVALMTGSGSCVFGIFGSQNKSF